MPLIYFSDGTARLGKLFGSHIVDLSIAAPDLPTTTIEFLKAGRSAVEVFHAVLNDPEAAIPLEFVRILPPVPRPDKFLGIGMNYRAHAAEAEKLGIPMPTSQVWFNKQISCIAGPYDDVVKPDATEKMDYEVELGVVIGRRCRHVPLSEARTVIGGYVVVNDVSARDWQFRTGTITLGKSFDTHGPIGPWLALDSEIDDPHNLVLSMFVNGERRQFAKTDDMIYNIYEQISYLSTVMTLEPGDILATGTPSGVGVALDPPRFLKTGDVMRAEIEGIGYIENRVVPEAV